MNPLAADTDAWSFGGRSVPSVRIDHREASMLAAAQDVHQVAHVRDGEERRDCIGHDVTCLQ